MAVFGIRTVYLRPHMRNRSTGDKERAPPWKGDAPVVRAIAHAIAATTTSCYDAGGESYEAIYGASFSPCACDAF